MFTKSTVVTTLGSFYPHNSNGDLYFTWCNNYVARIRIVVNRKAAIVPGKTYQGTVTYGTPLKIQHVNSAWFV